MSRDDSRIEVGGGRFPVFPALIALVLLALVVLGVAYAGRTPFGSEVAVSEELSTAVKEYLGRNLPRFTSRTIFYECSGFLDTIFSDTEEYAAAAELGAWRPGFTPDGSTGNLVIASVRTVKNGQPEISSKVISGGTFDPSTIPGDDPRNPCNLR